MELGGIGIGIGIDKMELTPCLFEAIECCNFLHTCGSCLYIFYSGSPPQQAEVAKSSMKVAKSSRSGIEIYNGEVALLQIGVMITSREVALSQKYLHIFLYKSIM